MVVNFLGQPNPIVRIFKKRGRNKINRYNKYSNKKTIVDGIKFDSKKESKRYLELNLLQRQGFITCLSLQPKFILQEKFTFDGKTYRKVEYIADFSYYFAEDPTTLIIEDVKGVKTDVFKLKHKLLLKSLLDKGIKFKFILT